MPEKPPKRMAKILTKASPTGSTRKTGPFKGEAKVLKFDLTTAKGRAAALKRGRALKNSKATSIVEIRSKRGIPIRLLPERRKI